MKNNTMMLVIVGIVVLALAAGFMMKGNKSQNTNSTEKTGAMTNTNDSAVQEEGVEVGGAMMVPSKDIVDNAVGSSDHTTLVAAVTAAGLVETLKGPGPFTVFAPTNSAFGKLPAGTVDTLVKPENKEKLTSILTYHVVPGKYTSKDLTEGMTLKTVNGQELTFTMKDGKWWINESAMIEIADVISSNGATHVVDTVLMPQ